MCLCTPILEKKKMLFEIFVICVLTVAVQGECTSNSNMVQFYGDLSCTSIRYKNQSCAEQFDCPNFTAYNKSQCHYNGISYGIGESLAANSTPSCSKLCTCFGCSGLACLQCQDVDCYERTRLDFPTEQYCIIQHSIDECCFSTEKICDKEAIALTTCSFLGLTYRQGDLFYPNNSCYKCICDENFDNSTDYQINKNCKRIQCDTQLNGMYYVQKGCAPIFSGGSSCCPFPYKCPAETDSIIPSSQSDIGNSIGLTCKFGNLTLQQNEKLNTNNICIDCACKLPPMIQCAQKLNCIGDN